MDITSVTRSFNRTNTVSFLKETCAVSVVVLGLRHIFRMSECTSAGNLIVSVAVSSVFIRVYPQPLFKEGVLHDYRIKIFPHTSPIIICKGDSIAVPFIRSTVLTIGLSISFWCGAKLLKRRVYLTFKDAVIFWSIHTLTLLLKEDCLRVVKRIQKAEQNNIDLRRQKETIFELSKRHTAQTIQLIEAREPKGERIFSSGIHVCCAPTIMEMLLSNKGVVIATIACLCNIYIYRFILKCASYVEEIIYLPS